MTRPNRSHSEFVGGHRNLPAGGQQTLPNNGHLLTQGAGGGGHDGPAGAPSTGTSGLPVAPSVRARYETRVLFRSEAWSA